MRVLLDWGRKPGYLEKPMHRVAHNTFFYCKTYVYKEIQLEITNGTMVFNLTLILC